MKTEYPFSPEEIEIFDIGNQTDIILRKNIAKEAIKRGEDERESTVYICEEVQTRKKGTITIMLFSEVIKPCGKYCLLFPKYYLMEES